MNQRQFECEMQTIRIGKAVGLCAMFMTLALGLVCILPAVATVGYELMKASHVLTTVSALPR